MPGLDIHAGIWLALEAAGIRATHLSGTSAGAIVSAAEACDISALRFAELLEALRDQDLREPRFAWQVRIPWLQSIFGNSKIRRFLEKYLTPPLSTSHIPLPTKPCQIWATRTQDCARLDVAASHDLVSACLASSAVPGILPPVILNGQEYVDGGLRYNCPLPTCWRNFDKVYILIASQPASDYKGTSALSRTIRALQTLMVDQILDVLDETHGAANVQIIWPDIATSAGIMHFDHSLIAAAKRETQAILARPAVSALIADEYRKALK
jgi:NTE family protein